MEITIPHNKTLTAKAAETYPPYKKKPGTSVTNTAVTPGNPANFDFPFTPGR